jgi:hypothetical protein
MRKRLTEKRTDMIDFLLENIICREISAEGDRVSFTGHDKDALGKFRKYCLRIISSPRDIPYDFKKDVCRFDEDRRELNAILDKLKESVAESNMQGIVPGFIFLRAEIERKAQANQAGKVIKNHGSFLKTPEYNKENFPYYDRTDLSRIELAVHQLYKLNTRNWNGELNRARRVLRNGSVYIPELVYFNPNPRQGGLGRVEAVAFADIVNPFAYLEDSCPICTRMNEDADHSECRETNRYLQYAKARNFARYSKIFCITRKVSGFDRRRRIKNKTVGFSASRLLNEKISLPEGEFYIATLR